MVFPQRQRKQRSQEPEQYSIAREAHVSIHVEGRESVSNAAKVTKWKHALSAVCRVVLCQMPCHNLYRDQPKGLTLTHSCDVDIFVVVVTAAEKHGTLRIFEDTIKAKKDAVKSNLATHHNFSI